MQYPTIHLAKRISGLLALGVLLLTLAGCGSGAEVAAKQDAPSFKVIWSIYVGWMPWGYAEEQGIVDKWAKKYGIEIDMVQGNDYIEAINQYTAGAYDAATMTNMDMLTIPAAGGVDSTALVVCDFSNGNDAIVIKKEHGDKLEDIKGLQNNLVELSVSHYALARALESVGLSERDVTLVNTSDADIVAAYKSEDVQSVTIWNPQLGEVLQEPNAVEVWNSSQIPGEIIDMMVINTETMNKHPELGKALIGAWYETMAIMSGDSEKAKAARTAMGEAAGTDLAGYERQLDATRMFYQAGEAADFLLSKELIDTMDKVAKFSFEHGLLGEGAENADAVGMSFPGGKTLGNTNNTRIHYTDKYLRMAADGKL